MATIVHLISRLGQFDPSCSLRLLAQAQAEAGNNVCVTTFASTPASQNLFEQTRVPCKIIRKRWGYDPFAARQLAQSLRERRPSLVHLWGRGAADVALVVRHALPTARIVATLADVPPHGKPWWPNRNLHAIDVIVVERAAQRADFVDTGQAEAKVHVVPPGFVAGKSTQSRRALLLSLGLPSDSRLVAIAGPLERWQLVDEAIWCFELIRILHDAAALVIVGDGPERTRLERFTRQVTDPGVVRFVPDSELLADVLAYSDVYWQPGLSRWIPSSLLAAMSHGVPVVAADVPTHREVVRHESNGFLVPPAKRPLWARQTDALLRDADLRVKIAQAAQQMVADDFSAAKMAQAYDRILRPGVIAKSSA